MIMTGEAVLNDNEDLFANCENEENQCDQQFVVAESIDMIAAYLSIRDSDLRLSVKQLVEKIASANRQTYRV